VSRLRESDRAINFHGNDLPPPGRPFSPVLSRKSISWRPWRLCENLFAVETYRKAELTLYAQMCGWSLALSHARSGDPAIISGYLGKSDAFDKALVALSVAYADQTEKDHAETKSVASGNVGERGCNP
jgi:hypothetical protein